MNTVTAFRVGEHYTNDQIRFSLKVENLGGIRPAIDSKKNLHHVVIMTAAEESGRSFADNPYYDRIEGDVLLYTAQGREGDQQNTGRNKRLLEQYSAPIPFYGFVNVGRQTYRFLGLLELLRHYPEVQADKLKTFRKVLLFEFRILSQPDLVPIDQADAISDRLINESRQRNPSPDQEREVTTLPADEKQVDIVPSFEVEELRSRLMQIKPHSFEHCIKALMERNGFSKVSVTSASGDGGIDINAYVDEMNDFFAGTHVQAQVKRWRHAVGNVEINKGLESLSTTAKGVFITTSHYTRSAIIEARHQTKPSITLIDGSRLSSIIIRSNLNVEPFL